MITRATSYPNLARDFNTRRIPSTTTNPPHQGPPWSLGDSSHCDARSRARKRSLRNRVQRDQRLVVGVRCLADGFENESGIPTRSATPHYLFVRGPLDQNLGKEVFVFFDLFRIKSHVHVQKRSQRTSWPSPAETLTADAKW